MHGFNGLSRPAPMAGLGSSPILSLLAELHRRYASDGRGAVANYIPELAAADPDHFGICLATVDGQVYEVGDSRQPFTIQSISKPFVYGLALEDRGAEAVLARVGVEPSGEAFNSIVFDERSNRPFNPMVNAGAIATTALIDGAGHGERLKRMLGMFARFTGRPAEIDEKVYLSEKSTGHRNRAITYLELNAGMIEEPVDDHLDLYFRQCSVLVDARDLAVMAATLANGGVHPLTGTVAMGRPEVRSILSVMSSCGMYNFSGEWGFRVGLPAKSGVSGGIIAALPGQFGIGVYSPLLDEQYNSVRGIAACEDLCRHFDLHVYEVRRTGSTVIRRELDGTTLRSKRQRPSWQQRILDDRGGEIVTFALQGDLFFAAMEVVCRRIFEPEREMRYLVLDGHRVGRIDGSARTLIEEVRDALLGRGVCLLLAGFSPAAAELLRAGARDPWPGDAFFACTDDALEWCEDRIIEASEPVRAAGDELLPLAALDLTAGCSADDAAMLGELVTRVDYRDGETIVREGDEARELFILAAGAASVRVRLGDGGRCKRVGAIEPGVTFGEFALFENSRRIADVIAAGPASCYVLPVERLTALAVGNPSLHARLLRNIMRGMADRLRRATDEIRALED